jgi:hypothetical protein
LPVSFLKCLYHFPTWPVSSATMWHLSPLERCLFRICYAVWLIYVACVCVFHTSAQCMVDPVSLTCFFLTVLRSLLNLFLRAQSCCQSYLSHAVCLTSSMWSFSHLPRIDPCKWVILSQIFNVFCLTSGKLSILPEPRVLFHLCYVACHISVTLSI